MQENHKLHEKARKYEAILNSLVDGVIIISRDMQALTPFTSQIDIKNV